MAYRKKYKRQTFEQKVRSNKSLSWFKRQKTELDAELASACYKISRLDMFTDHFLSSPEIKKLIKETEQLFQIRFRHGAQKPEGVISKLFKKSQIHDWAKEDERIAKLISEKELPITSSMRDFAKKEQIGDDLSFLHRKTESPEVMIFDVDQAKRAHARNIDKLTKRLRMLEPKLQDLLRKEERAQREKSVVARVRKKSRENAERVKVKLEKTTECPYCNEPLGAQPHADHIYPLSRGGQETESNMVYVCSRCNIAKSDKTLHTFCMDRGLSFRQVSARLRRMGKDF